MNTNDITAVEDLIETYSSFLLTNPYHVNTLILRGLLRETSGNHELALQDFNTLIKMGEKKALYLRAFLYCKMGETSLAIQGLNTIEFQGLQSSNIHQYMGYIAAQRAMIIKEIESDFLKEDFTGKYPAVDLPHAN